MTDSILKFFIDEAVKSMEKREGHRSALYLRAAHDHIHGRRPEDSTILEIALESFQEAQQP